MAKHRERLEIRFSGPMPALSALPDSKFLRRLMPTGARWRRLEYLYFDTPDRRLEKVGLSLSRRGGPTGSRQIVSSATDSGPFCRREWKNRLSGNMHFPAPTGNREIDQLLADCRPTLQQTFRHIADRWKAEFEFKTSVIEVFVDLGLASSGAETEKTVDRPISEARLRLKSGDPAELFALAKQLLHRTPLYLNKHTVPETAALIAANRQFAVQELQPFKASEGNCAEDILRRAVATAAERIIDLQAPVIEGRKSDGVRRMRVELRRFRAIELIFRDAAVCPRLRRLARQAKEVSHVLGPARDWDVFLDETLPSVAENHYAMKGLARLKSAAQQQRAEAWANATARIAAPAFSGLALDLAETAYLRPWRRKKLHFPARNFGERVLDRSQAKALKVAYRLDPANMQDFHRLRLALKKLRYGVQLFRGLYPKADRKPYMAAMAKLQDAFGVLNDAVTAPELADKAAVGQGPEAMRAAGFITGYYAARAEAAAIEIDAAWARFEKKQPFWRN